MDDEGFVQDVVDGLGFVKAAFRDALDAGAICRRLGGYKCRFGLGVRRGQGLCHSAYVRGEL